MLSQANRLKKNKDFEQVFKKGRGFKDGPLLLRLVKNNLMVSRFAFSVGLKVSKKAVVRNKIRRRLQEAVRADLTEVKTGFDLVFTALPGIESQNYQEIKERAERLLKKAGLLP